MKIKWKMIRVTTETHIELLELKNESKASLGKVIESLINKHNKEQGKCGTQGTQEKHWQTT